MIKIDKNKTDTQDENGYSALMLASHKGYTEIAKMLLAAGANVNVYANEGSTALLFASEQGNIDLVRALVNANVNINAQDKNGKTIWKI